MEGQSDCGAPLVRENVMFAKSRITRHLSRIAQLAALTCVGASLAFGQAPAPYTGAAQPVQGADTEWTALSATELEDLVGPIALYPDDLVAIVLPASTFPLQIVQASRYLAQRETNPELEPDPSWDDSVVALLNYPEVLALLNDDLDWTYDLGEAVVYQQGELLNAIQSFRDRAYAAGNLATDERQVIAAQDDGAITITPADPEVIYVPYYDPARVVVRSYVPAYYYYPYAYPVYYYPYPIGYSFSSSLFWGVTTAFLISWHDHYLHVHHPSHFGHPYYGYNYYTPWYARTSVYVNVNVGDHYRWYPSYHHGGRPRHPATYSRLKDATVVRTPAERRLRSGWIADNRQSDRRSEPYRVTDPRSGDDRQARGGSRAGRTEPANGGARRGGAATAAVPRDRTGRDRTANATGGGRLPSSRSVSPSGQPRESSSSRTLADNRANAGRGSGRPSAVQTPATENRGYGRAEQPIRSGAARANGRASNPALGRVAPSRAPAAGSRSYGRPEQPIRSGATRANERASSPALSRVAPSAGSAGYARRAQPNARQPAASPPPAARQSFARPSAAQPARGQAPAAAPPRAAAPASSGRALGGGQASGRAQMNAGGGRGNGNGNGNGGGSSQSRRRSK